MFQPKKTIPKLVATAFALTGCGDSSDGGAGGNGNGGSALSESLNSFCMTVVDCFPADYTDVSGCVNYISAGYNLDDASGACADAAASYFRCGANLSCEELEQISNDCDDEFAEAARECG